MDIKLGIIIVLLLVAGCVGPATETGDGSSDRGPRVVVPSESGPAGPEQGSGGRVPGINGPISLDDCEMRGATFFWPLGTAPGEPPAGWGEKAFSYVSGTVYLFFRCHRLNTTGLEQGPVQFLVEAHTNLPYNKCTAQTRAFQMVPFRIYVEGSSLATHIRENWGLNTTEVVFEAPTTPAGQFSVEKLSMKSAQTGASMLELDPIYPDSTDYGGPQVEELFWAHDGGIQSLRLEYEIYSYSPDLPVVTGSFQEPTVLAAEGLEHAVLASGFYSGVSPAGELRWMPLEECSS